MERRIYNVIRNPSINADLATNLKIFVFWYNEYFSFKKTQTKQFDELDT